MIVARCAESVKRGPAALRPASEGQAELNGLFGLARARTGGFCTRESAIRAQPLLLQ